MSFMQSRVKKNRGRLRILSVCSEKNNEIPNPNFSEEEEM